MQATDVLGRLEVCAHLRRLLPKVGDAILHNYPTATRLMLLDTASLYFRAFYGVPTSVTSPSGAPVNAARGCSTSSVDS